MQTLSNYSVTELRTVLAYLNAQPFTRTVAAKRAAIVQALTLRSRAGGVN